MHHVAASRRRRRRRPGRAARRARRPPSPSSSGSSTTPVSASTTSTSQVGRVLPQRLQVLLGGEAVGLAGLRRQVQRDQPPGAAAACSASASSGTIRCGSTLVNQDPGPEHQPVGLQHRLARPRAGGRVRRDQRDRLHPARGERAGHLAAHRARADAVELHLGLDVERHRGHRQHPAVRAEQPAHPVEARRPGRRAAPTAPRSAGCRPRGRAGRPRCGSGAGRPRSRCVPTRRRRTARPAPSAGHPAAARRARARSRPLEPPSSATVTTAVRSRGDPAQRGQRGVQPVPAAERDHPRPSSDPACYDPHRVRSSVTPAPDPGG